MESEAVKRISKLSIRYDHSWGVLREFIKVSEIGLNTAIPQIYEQKHGYAKELIYNPNFKPFVLQSEIQAQYTPEELGGIFASRSLVNARSATQAAAIIFAHTILDTCLHELCVITSLKYPERWDDDKSIKDKKVDISLVKEKGYAELRADLINKYLESIERQSIQTHIDVIYRLCNPQNWNPFEKGYAFDQVKLNKLDKLRHDIVHGRIAPAEVNRGDFEELLLFVEKTGLYFIFMVLHHYNMKIDLLSAFEESMWKFL